MPDARNIRGCSLTVSGTGDSIGHGLDALSNEETDDINSSLRGSA